MALLPVAILPSLQHWGMQWELVPEHFKAFPASTQGSSPATAAMGLTTFSPGEVLCPGQR